VKTISLLLLVSTASMCSLVFAQSKVTAIVEVKDESGAVVAGAEVSVAATTSSETAKVLQTSSNGIATLDLLPGTYNLSVKSQGFKVVNRRVVITDAERPTFPVILRVDSCPPGPCIVSVTGTEQVATEQSELPNVINDERTQAAARRSIRCLYLWRCSAR
jgi:hypothetical protein